MLSSYDTRVIRTGKIIEVIKYSRPVVVGFQRTKERTYADSRIKKKYDEQGEFIGLDLSELQEEKEPERRLDNLERSRKHLRRLINANDGQYQDEHGRDYRSVFLTLTFRENMTDLELANLEFKKFIKRLNFYINGSKESLLKYAAVPEIQQERFKKYGFAVWHYHLIVFNLSFVKVDKLGEIWGKGHVYINAIDEVNNVGAYVCKYMTKENKELLKGKKSYFCSRGLNQPEEMRFRGEDKKKELAEVEAQLADYEVFNTVYESENLGEITYKQYNLKVASNSMIELKIPALA